MGTLLITLVVMLILVAGMSVGVIFGRQPLRGSCGGVGKALGESNYECEICGGDEQKCEEQQEALTQRGRDLAYDASRDSTQSEQQKDN